MRAVPVLVVGGICALALLPVAAGTLDVHVVAIADGDSLTVRDSNGLTHGVRLAGIDAPEHGQPWGDRSKQNLSRMALNQNARIEWSERDDYGRIVAKLWVDSGRRAMSGRGLSPHAGHRSRAGHVGSRLALQEVRARPVGGGSAPLCRRRIRGTCAAGRPLARSAAAPPWEWRRGLTNGPVKKSRRNICHAPDSPTYRTVTRFSSYPTVEACLASGGRLPKPSGG